MPTDIIQYLEQLPSFQPAEEDAFGDVETVKLSRFQSIGGKFLARNWVSIPHVTHHDDVDVTALEASRKKWNAGNPDDRYTVLLPVISALAEALKEFPIFNSSLLADGSSIILKKYFNVGVAVNTPKGLLVPVLKGCDARDMADLRDELAMLSEKASTKGLTMDEMSGSSITVSSLGHIGGTAFSPIVNAPNVAILGMTKLREVAVRGTDNAVKWKTVLPLSLSYDHRVINGADAARFIVRLGELLGSARL